MRLAVDVMGGDHGPEELLQGVKLGLEAEPGIEKVFVVGPPAELDPLLDRIQLRGNPRVEVRPASEVITMNDDPAVAVRRKKDSSVLRTLELVREGEADAAISSGNTGGLYAGACIRLGRLPGVVRPTIACILPSFHGAWVLVDGGANPECTAEHLMQFGVMGSAYAKAMLGLPTPRVGVLSNGSEDAKGTDLTRAAVELLRSTGVNCRGYCEGYDLFMDGVDVCVCDGFVGNIVLKSAESLGKAVRGMLKEELTASPIRKLGALMSQGGLRRIAERMNPEAYGGAPILGMKGWVFKIHGSAKRTSLRHAMRQAERCVDLKLNDILVADLAAAEAATVGKAPKAASPDSPSNPTSTAAT
jgi:glycerol-3-phosphate acyltransferase PlsX